MPRFNVQARYIKESRLRALLRELFPEQEDFNIRVRQLTLSSDSTNYN